MNRLSLVVRAILGGRFHFAWITICVVAYGLTHRHCRKCGYLKGLNSDALCAECMMRNLVEGLRCETCQCSIDTDDALCPCECHQEELEEV